MISRALSRARWFAHAEGERYALCAGPARSSPAVAVGGPAVPGCQKFAAVEAERENGDRLALVVVDQDREPAAVGGGAACDVPAGRRPA